MDSYQKIDLEQAQNLLDRLLTEVHDLESPLAGGVRSGIASQKLQKLTALKNTEVGFGNPKFELVKLTKALFTKLGLELNEVIKEHMKEYNFFYCTLPLFVNFHSSIRLSKIICNLDFGPKDTNEPIIHTFFPQNKWNEILKCGIELEVALNSMFEWEMGLPTNFPLESLPTHIKAQGLISNKNALKGFIAFKDYNITFGHSEIRGSGMGSSKCSWIFERPDLMKNNSFKVGVVFKVPKELKKIDLEGTLIITPNLIDIGKLVHNVYDFLSRDLKNLFDSKKTHKKKQSQLPLGQIECWQIQLPE